MQSDEVGFIGMEEGVGREPSWRLGALAWGAENAVLTLGTMVTWALSTAARQQWGARTPC